MRKETVNVREENWQKGWTLRSTNQQITRKQNQITGGVQLLLAGKCFVPLQVGQTNKQKRTTLLHETPEFLVSLLKSFKICLKKRLFLHFINIFNPFPQFHYFAFFIPLSISFCHHFLFMFSSLSIHVFLSNPQKILFTAITLSRCLGRLTWRKSWR